METWGTGHHNKGPDGRAKEIEGYIDQGVEWILQHISVPEVIVDLGCDTGYMLHKFLLEIGKKSQKLISVFGVDLYYDKSLFRDVPIIREDIQSPILLGRLGVFGADLVILNHSLEHVMNPHLVMQNIRLLKPKHVFIALPHCDSPWVSWDSHMSAWNEAFLEHFMKMYGFRTTIAKCLRSFRNDEETSRPLVEIWQIFR